MNELSQDEKMMLLLLEGEPVEKDHLDAMFHIVKEYHDGLLHQP